MNAKWYVEYFDDYEERGGFYDISEPFDIEAEARAYAASLSYARIALFKVENNLFTRVDIFNIEDSDEAPAGWFSAFTQAELDNHAVKRAQERAREHDEMLRDMARAQAGHPDAPLYARAGTTGYLTAEDVAKIAAYRAEYEAEMAAQ